MISSEEIWITLFFTVMISYLSILYLVENKKKYFLYCAFGIIFGFYFDIVSYSNGYYTYPDFYKITILGLPLTMTLAEGFSVGIAIYLYSIVINYSSNKKLFSG